MVPALSSTSTNGLDRPASRLKAARRAPVDGNQQPGPGCRDQNPTEPPRLAPVSPQRTAPLIPGAGNGPFARFVSCGRWRLYPPGVFVGFVAELGTDRMHRGVYGTARLLCRAFSSELCRTHWGSTTAGGDH